MPTFTILSRVDAYVDYTAEVEADDLEEAVDLAYSGNPSIQWKERGVVAVGLAWAKPSRFAGGNSTDLGLTELGRALVREPDAHGWRLQPVEPRSRVNLEPHSQELGWIVGDKRWRIRGHEALDMRALWKFPSRAIRRRHA